jgi:hypothetical protein
MQSHERFGDRAGWDKFLGSMTNYFGDWLYTDTSTYYGVVEEKLPHGYGRMVYKNGDFYEGHWKHGSMVRGLYVKCEDERTSTKTKWTFLGTFEGGDCPIKGIFSDESGGWDIECTEKKSIHTIECWHMLKYLRNKRETDKEKAENDLLFAKKREEERKLIEKFKKMYIKGMHQEIDVTIGGHPAKIFLCSGENMITSTYVEADKSQSIMTTIPRVPVKIEVWVWSKYDLQARMDEGKIKNIFYNPDRKVGELEFEGSNDDTGASHILYLNLSTIPGVTAINLQFRREHTRDVGDAMVLGLLLDTLKTYA